MSLLPRQKLSTKKKFKVDKDTGLNNIHETANYYIDQTIDIDKDEIRGLYGLLEDEIDEEEYKYVLNPFNTKITKYTKFRGKLRNYNIISPVIEMNLSEFGKRPHLPQVLQSNPSDETEYEKALDKFWKGYLAQVDVNSLNELGVETGMESKEMPEPKEAVKEFENSYTSDRLIEGQNILEYIIYNEDLADKYIELYRNYLVCGQPLTFKSVRNDDVDFEVIPPNELYFPFSRKRIEDREWVVRKYRQTPNQLLDNYGDFISDKLLDKIDEYNSNNNLDSSLHQSNATNVVYMSDDDFNKKHKYGYTLEEEGILTFHCQYKSFKRVAILEYRNLVGEFKEKEVSDDYKLDKENGDIKLEYKFIPAIYEALKVVFDGEEEFIFADEYVYDRTEVNNKTEPKFGYNGLTLLSSTGEVMSTVKSGKNYQLLYNIMKYTFEKTINKNKDKLAVIPLGLMSKGKKGWDEEKSMYYAEANSTLFIDETSPNANLALQGIKVLDMSLGKYIGEIINFAESIRQEWWDAIGMNRQRYGKSLASDGKSNNEQAIYRSSLITENSLRKFEKLQEKDYQGLLDLSKFAYINGKKGKYINNKGREAFLDLNADNAIYHTESSYDVHVKFSKDEEEKIQKLEQYLFNYSQNNGDLGVVLEAMSIKSFEMGKEVIKELDEKQKQRQEQESQAERKSSEKVAQLENETTNRELDLKEKEIDLKYAETEEIPEDTSLEDGKTNAEIDKIEAETEKIKSETNSNNLELNNKS